LQAAQQARDEALAQAAAAEADAEVAKSQAEAAIAAAAAAPVVVEEVQQNSNSTQCETVQALNASSQSDSVDHSIAYQEMLKSSVSPL
jgi:hypothetical protein